MQILKTVTLTAMNMEASNEKQKPISAKGVLKASGRCLPSLSMSACESLPADAPISVSFVSVPFCSGSIIDRKDVREIGKRDEETEKGGDSINCKVLGCDKNQNL